jgi:hypothetical protein
VLVPLGVVAPGSQIRQVTRSGLIGITTFIRGDGGMEKDPEWLHLKEYLRSTALGLLENSFVYDLPIRDGEPYPVGVPDMEDPNFHYVVLGGSEIPDLENVAMGDGDVGRFRRRNWSTARTG